MEKRRSVTLFSHLIGCHLSRVGTAGRTLHVNRDVSDRKKRAEDPFQVFNTLIQPYQIKHQIKMNIARLTTTVSLRELDIVR
jgi:hypothetical protein